VEDVCGFNRSGVVGRIRNPLVTSLGGLLHEGINLRVSTTRVGETRNLEVDQVIVATERTIHTKGSDKLRRGGITNVLTEFAVVTDKLTAGLRAGDQTEDSGTILTTEGVVTSTITNKLNTDGVKLILSKLEGRNGNGVQRTAVFRGVASLNLGNESHILSTAAVIENRLGKLGKLLHGLGNLRLDLERGLEVIQADARGLVALGLEIPVSNALTEGQIIGSRDATRGGGSVRGGDIAPIRLKRARKNTLNRDFVEGGSHTEGELANTSQATPRGLDLITLLDVNGEATSLPLEEVVNCRTGDSHNSL